MVLYRKIATWSVCCRLDDVRIIYELKPAAAQRTGQRLRVTAAVAAPAPTKTESLRTQGTLHLRPAELGAGQLGSPLSSQHTWLQSGDVLFAPCTNAEGESGGLSQVEPYRGPGAAGTGATYRPHSATVPSGARRKHLVAGGAQAPVAGGRVTQHPARQAAVSARAPYGTHMGRASAPVRASRADSSR